MSLINEAMAAIGEIERLRAENMVLRAENDRLRAASPLGIYPQQDETTTTVVARIRAMGARPSKRLAWRVGSVVRQSWEKSHGSLPVKANTAKVSGTGSHCHARYPLEWAPRIDAIIAHHAGIDGVQRVFVW